MEYARLFQKQEQYLTAYALGKRACALCKENTAAYLPELADTLHLLFFVERRMDWDEIADETGHRAVPHYRKLIQGNPDTYAIEFSELLRSLGFIQYYFEKYDEAVKNHQEIVDIYRKLPANNPDAYEEKLISAMQDLSYTQCRAGRLDAAQKTNNEAIHICRQGLRTDPKKYKPLLAYTFQHAAYSMEGRKEKERNYIEAIAVYRELAQENPDEYLPALADILHEWGRFQNDYTALGRAEERYRTDLKSDSILLKARGVFNRFVHSEKQDIANARTKLIYKEALQIHHKIFPNKPYWQIRELAELLSDLADMQNSTAERKEALKNYEEALPLQRALITHHKFYRELLARTLSRLGYIYGQEDAFEKIRKGLQGSDRSLPRTEPGRAQTLHGQVYLNLAEFK